MTTDFYPIRKLYHHAHLGTISTRYIDVITQTATFRHDYHPSGEAPAQTPFEATGIFPVMMSVPDDLHYIHSLSRSPAPFPVSQAVADYAIKLERVIEQHWNPSLFHVHFHSAGWDSRNISAIIRKLYQKHGRDWLGDVLFLCAKWEGDGFKEIMHREGWDESQYFVYNEDVPEGEYFASAFDFSTAWEQLGAPLTFPVNQWWFMIGDLQKAGRLPDSNDIQAIGGLWANETAFCLLDGGAKWDRMFKGMYYCHVMASLPVKAKHVLLPFTHYTLMESLPTYGLGGLADTNATGFRSALASRICPDLDDIPNPCQRDPMHPISDRLFEKIKSDYRASKFAQVRPSAPDQAAPITDFREWWANWSLASLWEHLSNLWYTFN